MGSVTSLEGRAPRPTQNFRCSCGGEWFEARGSTPDLPPAVVFDQQGRITGRALVPVCMDCGKVPNLPFG